MTLAGYQIHWGISPGGEWGYVAINEYLWDCVWRENLKEIVEYVSVMAKKDVLLSLRIPSEIRTKLLEAKEREEHENLSQTIRMALTQWVKIQPHWREFKEYLEYKGVKL